MCDTIFDQVVEDLINQPGEMTMEEFRLFADTYCRPPAPFVRYHFDYTPPWIDDELLEYSLKGVSSLKV